MKIRSDFVTNSSSSSFIIGKGTDENYTIESVFQIIKELYKELLRKRDNVIEYLDRHPDCEIEYRYNKERDYYSFGAKKSARGDKYREAVSWFERMFGIEIYSSIPSTIGWFDCETYKDYLKYWNKDKFRNAPFLIEDFSDPDFSDENNWNHYEILCWYNRNINEEKIEKWSKKQKSKKLLALGRICIYSECGYIQEYVVEKLGEISQHWCNHMG